MRGVTANLPTVIAEEENLGPAMRALTPNQRNYVVALVTRKARNNTQAAMMAGYGGTDEATRVAAKILNRNPRVILAIREEADKVIRSAAVLGANVLREMVDDPSVPAGVRRQCANDLLDRSDLQVTTKHEVNVKHETSDELKREIAEIARRLGQDPSKFIDGPIIEAQYTEVIAPRTDERSGADGLEDMLA